ncbi:MAG: hypothetical protein KZQ78_04000 [Candidatus Thiodiazotropha sp. (ex Ustalcina ferruginea)]|nr:hypothetical protein [Candidatus Thiodiazotropha sp. (ex Ustalcina ferruginea)]
MGSAASGGLLGLAGTGIQALLKFYEVREERKTQIALRELDIKEIEAERQLAIQQAEIDLDKIREQSVGDLAIMEERVAGEVMTVNPALPGFVCEQQVNIRLLIAIHCYR